MNSITTGPFLLNYVRAPEGWLALPHLTCDVITAWATCLSVPLPIRILLQQSVQERAAGHLRHNSHVRPLRPSSLQKRWPSAFRMMPPTPRRACKKALGLRRSREDVESVYGRCQNDVCAASAARNLILASASSGFTRPVGWTCTHSRSMVFAPIS